MAMESDRIWFDDDDYINTEVSFPSGSVWRIDKKVHEHDYYEHQEMEQVGLQSEARASFFCSKISGDGPSSAFLKIRMQIPWYGTAHKKPAIRAQQASSKIPRSFHSEIEGLLRLAEAHCSSTPCIFDCKKEEQADDEWVPGGFKLFLLMQRLPGSDPSHLMPPVPGYEDTSREERDDLRAAFKTAWLETIHCGIKHQDSGIRNLIWDKHNKKCYLIDWEHWSPSTDKDVWKDHIYIGWHLARSGPSHNYFDMSDWEL